VVNALVLTKEIYSIKNVPSEGELAAARFLAAKGAHVVVGQGGGSQMGFHVANGLAFDHGGVAAEAVASQG
jgi:hypothetical protein